MFEELMEKLEAHPRYGPAMHEAVKAKEELVLNYHHHGDPSSWCVAICARAASPVAMLNLGGEMRELAHVTGLGGDAESCWPLMSNLAEELVVQYSLTTQPVIYRQGEPFEETST